ncbi:MAG: cysteine desulfurase [Bacteroidetes bacterium MedPE-SWsnd-G1]|nr:MAG: cysteine desulfurase [Bacteroidetes bacterium MedPE-SWsnd-G1]
MNRIYLDSAATSRMDSAVIEAMSASMAEIYGNPSSSHQYGRAAKSKIERARRNIAKLLNVTPSEIVFTAGGSEADNMILRNAVCHLGVKRIISSKIEHHAVLHTLDVLEEDEELQVDYVNLNEDGSVDMNHFEQLVSDTTHKTLVSLMYVNNEIGTVLDAKKVSDLCKQNDTLFHSDAVQVIGHYNLDLQEIPIDFIVASAHKFHGPKGIGFAYFRKGIGIKPLLTGGAQERGARAGTENVHGIVGMDKALEIVYKDIDKEAAYVNDIKKYFLQRLKEGIPGVAFNGCPEDEQRSNYCLLNVRFPGNSDMLLFSLDIKGISASGGSACQSGASGGSHVLNTILPMDEAKKTSVRFSFSKFNTKDEIDQVIVALKEILKV